MATHQFEVVFETEEDGGFHAFVPALKGCHSYGTTREEARRNVVEAIELWLETAQQLGLRIPEHEVVQVKVQ